jgi:ribonuclease D
VTEHPPASPGPEARRTISHEELMALPILKYTGPVQVVATQAELRSALQEIRRERVVGFDTETRPTFRKGQSHAPSLVQIATNRKVSLFQLARLDCSEVLAEILSHPRILKAGIALARDLSDLQKLFPFETANVVDLGEVAKKGGIQQTGLRNLAGLFLGGRVTKGARTSNWSVPELTPSQRIYAATDAWICRELYLRFEADDRMKPPAPDAKEQGILPQDDVER